MNESHENYTSPQRPQRALRDTLHNLLSFQVYLDLFQLLCGASIHHIGCDAFLCVLCVLCG